jgi:hypothetical protein
LIGVSNAASRGALQPLTTNNLSIINRNLQNTAFAGSSPNRAQTYQLTRVLQWGNPTIFRKKKKPKRA